MTNVPRRGFTLVELLVVLLIITIAMVAMMSVFALHNRTYVQQEQSVALEENLRIGMTMIADPLRVTGYPDDDLESWITWMGSFTENPRISPGGSLGGSDAISIAACASRPVATLSADAPAGTTTLSVTPTGAMLPLDAASRSFIIVGDEGKAHVRSVTSGSIGIDTDRDASNGQEGFSRPYYRGTPICRVDVTSFDVFTDSVTGVPHLRRNLNQGGGWEPMVEGISDFRIDPQTGGESEYTLDLSARTRANYPGLGDPLTRSLRLVVSIRNRSSP